MSKTHFADDETLEYIASLEQRNGRAVKALAELLEQVDSLEGYSLTRDIESYKAQAVWDDTIENARSALAKTKE
jgi:hypothetical protein